MQRDFVPRRKQIANEMAVVPVKDRLAIIGTVDLKYGLCNMNVRTGCKEFRVTIPKIPHWSWGDRNWST